MKYILFLFLILVYTLNSQPTINNIYINNGDVFDSTKKEWFWGAKFLNSIHATTKIYIIEDQLLFKEEDYLDEELLYETERNLRNLGIFTDVSISLDSVGYNAFDVIINTQDRWSTSPVILFGHDGDETTYGGKISEKNFLGHAIDIELEYLNRSENEIGNQGRAYLNYPKMFRSPLDLLLQVQSNRFKTEQYYQFQKPYQDLNSTTSYGLFITNNFGKSFLYNQENNLTIKSNVREKIVKAFYSRAWRKLDRVFISSSLEFDDSYRGKDSLYRAFDNSGKFLLSFSSISEEYYPTSKLNSYFDEDLPVGGYGEAVLGKTFKLNDFGTEMYIMGGRGEKSYLWNNSYLYAMIMGGSGYSSELRKFKHTYEEFLLLGFHRFNDDILFSLRFKQQTAWNLGPEDRQLILDSDSGIRGISANNFSGDNRIISNFEFRFFPEWKFWIFNLSGAAFFDVGTVWDRNQGIENAKFQKTAGIGFRIHNQKISGPSGLFRIDFAFDFNKRQFAGIIFTSDQLFSIFKKHEYRIPEIYGLEYDDE